MRPSAFSHVDSPERIVENREGALKLGHRMSFLN